MGRFRVDIYYTLVLVYHKCTVFWLFYPLISSTLAKTSRKRFFLLGYGRKDCSPRAMLVSG